MTASIPPLASQYEPFDTEAKWQKLWEDHQVFKADPEQSGESYCIVIPPPNVTGSLHMGHAFEHSLIDALVRYHRMCGFNTLWLPGTDHASIAVSTILDKELQAQKKTRFDVGREAYLERAWQWKEESGGTIVGQLRRLGLSLDWSRERFTMDQGLSRAVLEAFNRLYREGLIYRGKYMVNWCPASQSAVSDLEVDNREVNGSLWHFRYPLTDGSGFVEVATTRPETMLGDTAVAVNPNDERYQAMIGKTVRLPILNREIPIIADAYVDPAFGTGCVKITPAHDPNDFEMGKRHNLPMITIMNKDGTLNEQAGDFQGQDRFVARKNVVQRLEADGFLVKIEAYKHTVPYSDRGKVPVEPLLSTQWFVNIRPLADKTLDALDRHSEPNFVPERWTKVYRDWLVNLRDWCISRQLWWGHRIPAWYAVNQTAGEITDTTPFVVATSEAEAWEKARAEFGADVQLEQDPDVLDTWFSSGLWPFSTMGWPDQTADFSRYYPTKVLVTGFDIIFFWVARMTMMATHLTGEMPFKTVYVHGLVLDENGKKMSKSANNGIDPLILINKYGTDAVRYTLVREVVGAGQDIRLEYNRKTDESASVEASRNFTNKLWNASRFVMMNLGSQTPAQLGQPNPEALELSDRWILSRYHQVIQQTRKELDQYGLGEAAKGLYEFFWGDLCDWYIELVKSRLQPDAPSASKQVAQQTLATVLEGTLRLLHPFLPHITEEVWHTLTQTEDERSLALQSYPEANANLINANLEQQFDRLIDAIRTIRNLRAEAEIKPGVKIQTILETEDEQERQILIAGQAYIQDLAKVEQLTIVQPLPEAPAVEAAAATSAALDSVQLASDLVLPELDSPELDSPELSPREPEIKSGGEQVESPVQRLPLDESNFSKVLAEWDLQSLRKPAITLGFLVLLVILLKIVFSVLTAIDSLPLIAPLLKLIGAGYTAWFLFQFLRRPQSRQSFTEKLKAIRLRSDQPVIMPPPAVKVSSSSPSTPQTPPAAVPVSVTLESEVIQPPLSQPEQPQPEQPQPEQPSQMYAGVSGTIQILIPLAGVVDIEGLRARLQKDLLKAQAEIDSLSQRLANPNFVDKARPDVVQNAKTALAEAEKQAEILQDRLKQLQN